MVRSIKIEPPLYSKKRRQRARIKRIILSEATRNQADWKFRFSAEYGIWFWKQWAQK
jgi:hypothetical protein